MNPPEQYIERGENRITIDAIKRWMSEEMSIRLSKGLLAGIGLAALALIILAFD